MLDFSFHHQEIAPAPTQEQVRVEQLKWQVAEYMSQLHGWCSLEQASFLIDLIQKTKPKVIVEIGVWGGRSLIPMARALKENGQGIVYGIDPWSNAESIQWVMEEENRTFWNSADHNGVYRDLIEKIGQFDLGSQIKLLRSTSEDAPPIHGIDLLHIDGNHSDYTSYLDVTKWVPLVNRGGWIIFDDLKWFENGVFTTTRAERWLDANCYKFAEFTDVCTWGVWIKP